VWQMLTATRLMSMCDRSPKRAIMSSQTRRMCSVKSNGDSMPTAGSKLLPEKCYPAVHRAAPGPGLVPARELRRCRLGRLFAKRRLLGPGHLAVTNADEFDDRARAGVA